MKKYLWIKSDGSLKLVDNPIDIIKLEEYSEGDKFYQVGSEVKVKIVLEPQSSYRREDLR